MTSRNVAVIQVILNLNCDTAIKSSNIASDNAAARAGRRRINSQTQFSAIHARSKQALGEKADLGLK